MKKMNKTKNIKLSPNDKLPSLIDAPERLIKQIIRKITINSKATNLNNTFQWINLAEKTLRRFSNFDDRLIAILKYNLASVLFEKSDLKKAKKLLKDAINTFSKQNKVDKKFLANSYYKMADTLRRLDDFNNALTSISHAIKINNNNCNYYSALGRILFKLDKTEEAELNFKIALKMSTKKYGKTDPHTASIIVNYGIFLASTGKMDIAKKYINNAYSIFKKTLGEDNLNTNRSLGWISDLLYIEKKYAEAFKNMETVFNNTKLVLGNNNIETVTCKYNCARSLIKMKKYNEAIDYLDFPFAITDKKENVILLAYNNIVMVAPEVFITKTGSSSLRILNILKSKNIPIFKNTKLTKDIINDVNEFEDIPRKYWKVAARIMKRIWDKNNE